MGKPLKLNKTEPPAHGGAHKPSSTPKNSSHAPPPGFAHDANKTAKKIDKKVEKFDKKVEKWDKKVDKFFDKLFK